MQGPPGTGDDPDVGDWPLPGDPDVHVGARHHLIPRFYLERFARNGRIAVVDPRTHQRRISSIKDTAAERDFYSFVNLEGELDGRLEQLLSKVEGDAARVIRNLTSVFASDPTDEDRFSLCLLLAFQLNRGRASRRRLELLADLTTRLLAEGIEDEQAARSFLARRGSTDPEPAVVDSLIAMSTHLDEYQFVPDPNEHIGMIGRLAHEVMPYIWPRPWILVEFDKPALVTCDEPVTMNFPGVRGGGAAHGLANAEALNFPLDPRRLLILGPSDSTLPALTRIHGSPDAAVQSNSLAAHNAYEAVFMHPDVAIEIPSVDDGPLFNVTTDASATLARYNQPLTDRRTLRRRSGDRRRAR